MDELKRERGARRVQCTEACCDVFLAIFPSSLIYCRVPPQCAGALEMNVLFTEELESRTVKPGPGSTEGQGDTESLLSGVSCSTA